MLSIAEQLGFAPEYRVALEEGQDVKIRPQMEHPGLYFVEKGMERHGGIQKWAEIKQYNYQKEVWSEVHRIAGVEQSFVYPVEHVGVVLVNNLQLYVIDGERRSRSRPRVSFSSEFN